MLPIPSLNTVDVGSESLSATLNPTKAFSEYLVETILAFVEALGQNVVMLHSDQEPVLVRLLKAVQSRRVKRTLVRHGPRATKVKARLKTLSCDVAVTRESLAREAAERQHPDSVAGSSRSVVPDEISSEKRRENCVCAQFWESVHEPSVAIRRKSDV